jgi:hypothetical protein
MHGVATAWLGGFYGWIWSLLGAEDPVIGVWFWMFALFGKDEIAIDFLEERPSSIMLLLLLLLALFQMALSASFML